MTFSLPIQNPRGKKKISIQNLSTGTPATKDSIYDLGSISKTFAALLMGKLFTEQKLRLWDPLDDFLPYDLGLRDEDGTPIQVQ